MHRYLRWLRGRAAGRKVAAAGASHAQRRARPAALAAALARWPRVDGRALRSVARHRRAALLLDAWGCLPHAQAHAARAWKRSALRYLRYLRYLRLTNM